MTKEKRSDAQRKADKVYEQKRAAIPRFGGRCSPIQKKQLTRLAEQHQCDEKTLIFTALDFFEKNHKER